MVLVIVALVVALLALWQRRRRAGQVIATGGRR